MTTFKDLIGDLYYNLMLKDEMYSTFGRFAFLSDRPDIEKLAFLYEMPDVQKLLSASHHAPSPKYLKVKSQVVAEQMRITGNTAFNTGDLSVALNYYITSIMLAIKGTRELGLAFANRSAVAYRLQHYDKCIRDINESLANNYPKETEYKLHRRKAECYTQLCDIKNAIQSYNDCEYSINHSNLTGQTRTKQIEDIDFAIKNLKQLPKTAIPKPVNAKLKLPEVTGKLSDVYPCASDAFTVEHSNVKGRHAVAGRSVDIGDVILVEKPYVSCLIGQSYNNKDQYTDEENVEQRHCLHCCKSLMYGLPCDKCCVMFCSHICKELAWIQYHKEECCNRLYLQDLNVPGISHLATRITHKLGLQNVLSVHKKVDDFQFDGSRFHTTQDQHVTNQYLTFCSLQHHTKEHTSKDYLHLCILSLVLVDYLEKTTFFRGSKGPIAQERLIVASHLLHTLLTLKSNSVLIHTYGALLKYASHYGGDIWATMTSHDLYEERLVIAHGMYNTAALLNHSCEPNAILVFYNNILVLRAIKPIKPGDDITINYGKSYQYENRADRNKRLDHVYHFTCTCRVCTENWSVLDGDDWSLFAKLCPRFKCGHCSVELEPNEQRKLYCSKCECYCDEEKLTEIAMNIVQEFNLCTATPDAVREKIRSIGHELVTMDKYYVQPSIHYELRQSMLAVLFCNLARAYDDQR